MNTLARRIAPLVATILVAPLLVGGLPDASAQEGDDLTDPAYAFALGAPPSDSGDADGTNMLWRFDLRHPLQTNAAGPRTISDLDEGEVVVGIDFDPASEQLYGLTRTPVTDGSTADEPATGLGRIVVIDPQTGVAHPLRVPEVDAPDVTTTSVEAPDVTTTSVEAPDVTTTSVEAPDVTTTSVELPDLADLIPASSAASAEGESESAMPIAGLDEMPAPVPFPLRGTEFGISFGPLAAADGAVDLTATTGSLLYVVSDAGEKLVIDPVTGALLAQTQMIYGDVPGVPDPDIPETEVPDPGTVEVPDPGTVEVPAAVPELVGLAEAGDGLWAIDSATDEIVDVTGPVMAVPLETPTEVETDRRAALDVAADGTVYTALTDPFSTTASRLFVLDEAGAGTEVPPQIGGGFAVSDIALPPTGTIAFDSEAVSVDEDVDGGTVAVTVERTGGTFGTLEARVVTDGGSATEGEACGPGIDYLGVSEEITFSEGDDEFDVPIVICDDGDAESPEDFTVDLVPLNAPHIIGDPSSTTVTIEDDEPGTVQFASPSFSGQESGEEVDVTIVPTGDVSELEVHLVTRDLEAGAHATGGESCGTDVDYVSTDSPVGFPAQAPVSRTIEICDDSEVEGDEEFTATLVVDGDVADTAAVTILDDPAGTVAFENAEGTVAEGNDEDDEPALTVTRTDGTEGEVTVAITSADDSATAGSDYEAVDTTVTFTAGSDESQEVHVTAHPDGEIEEPETFEVSLDIDAADGDPSAGDPFPEVGDPSTATVTIFDRTLGTALVLTGGDTLVGFDPDSPETATDPIDITGLAEGQEVVGIDYAPVAPDTEPGTEDSLYAVTRDAQRLLKLYTLELPADAMGAMAAAAAPVGEVCLPPLPDPLTDVAPECLDVIEALSLAPAVLGAQFGVDVNPADGMVHVTSDEGEHVVFDPATGLAAVNVPLTYGDATPELPGAPEVPEIDPENPPDPEDPPDVGGLVPDIDPNVDTPGVLAQVVSIAHGAPAGGAPALFGLDADRDALVVQEDGTTLGDGRLAEVGELVDAAGSGIDLPVEAGFDVLGDDLGFAAFATGGDLAIHSVALTAEDGEVVVTPRGVIGDGNATGLDLAIRPAGVLAFDGDVTTDEHAAETRNLTVSRTGGTGYEVTVDYEIVPDDEDPATCGEDYVVLVGVEETCELTGTLTFGSGVSDRDITIRVLDDDEWEGEESFTASLSDPTSGAVLGAASSATFTIDEDEAEIGTISFGADAYEVDEDAPKGTVTLRRDGGTEGEVVVVVTSEDDHDDTTAQAGDDYEPVETTVTFGPGDGADKPVDVIIHDDELLEGDEDVVFEVVPAEGSPAPVDIDANADEATLTIRDVEPGRVYGVTDEGNQRLVEFEPGRPADAVEIGTLSGLADGDEIVAVDFNPLDGNLYGLGAQSRVYTVSPEADDNDDVVVTEIGDGFASPGLNGTRFGADFDPADGTLRVVSQATQNLVLSIDPATDTVSHAPKNSLVFGDDTPGTPRVVAVAHPATGADDIPLFGIDHERDALVEHRTGGDDCRCELHVVGDLVDEHGEGVDATDLAGFDTDGRGRGLAVFESGSSTVYAVDLTNPDGSVDEIGVVDIGGEGDTPGLVGVSYVPAGLLQFAGGPGEPVFEADQEVTLEIERVDGTKLPVAATVAVTGDLDGLTVAMIDGVPVDGDGDADAEVEFGDGDAGPHTVTVAWDDNDVDEHDAELTVSLVNPTRGAAIGSPGEVTIDVADDDDPPTVSVHDASEVEGDSATTTVDVPVRLSNASGKTIELEYETVDGTARAGFDYKSKSGILTIEPGTEDPQIEVEILGDTFDEPDETFTVRIVAAENATIASATATVTVIDDDPRPSLSATGVTVPEGDSGMRSVSIPVRLSAPSGRAVSVSFSTADGTATAGADYAPTSGTLRFPPGRIASGIRVSVRGDTVDEPDETFTVRLSAPSHASLSARSVTVTIVDDDEPAPEIEGVTLGKAPVNSQSTPDGRGYWIATPEGDVFGFGNAERFGSLRGAVATAQVGAPVVELVATPEGDGYWLLDDQGGVHTFGDARFFGSLPGRVQRGLVGPAEVTGMARTPSGNGYVILDEQGGVHTFGDATFHGSIPARRGAGVPVGFARATSIAVTPSGNGYVILDEQGGVHTFGDATFLGSIPGLRASGVPVGQTRFVSLAVTPDGRGYWILDEDGGVHTFGNATFHGSIPGLVVAGQSIGNAATTSIEPAPGGAGYWIFDQSGGVFTFGDARFAGSIPGLRRG